MIGLEAVLERYAILRKDLAREIGCTEGAVSLWASGQRDPHARTMLRIVSYVRRNFDPAFRAEDLYAKDGRANLEEVTK